MVFKIMCGLEIELEYNAELVEIDEIYGYHSRRGMGTFSKNFKAESDGSLHAEHFPEGRTAEIISKKFNIKKYKDILCEFQQQIYNITSAISDDETDLSKHICFNNSTGAHIHFGFYETTGKKKIPMKFITPKKLNVLNGLIIEELNKYPQFTKIVENWYRKSYAKEMDLEEYDTRTIKNERYMSWNYRAGNTARKTSIERLELRSFNLRGVTCWKDFHLAYDIVFKVVKDFFTNEYNNNLEETEEIKLEETTIITYLNKAFSKEDKVVCEIDLNNIELPVSATIEETNITI